MCMPRTLNGRKIQRMLCTQDGACEPGHIWVCRESYDGTGSINIGNVFIYMSSISTRWLYIYIYIYVVYVSRSVHGQYMYDFCTYTYIYIWVCAILVRFVLLTKAAVAPMVRLDARHSSHSHGTQRRTQPFWPRRCR